MGGAGGSPGRMGGAEGRPGGWVELTVAREEWVELTIPAAVARAASEFGDAAAIAGPGRPALSYRELGERVTAVAGALIGAGVEPGDRVALWAPNGCRLGAGRAGRARRGRGARPGQHAVHRTRGAGRDQPQRGAGAIRGRRLPRRRPAGDADAAAAAAGGELDRLGLVVRVPEEWDAFWGGARRGHAGRGAPARGSGAAGGRQRHHVHLGHHGAEQGRDDLARAAPWAWPGPGPSARG